MGLPAAATHSVAQFPGSVRAEVDIADGDGLSGARVDPHVPLLPGAGVGGDAVVGHELTHLLQQLGEVCLTASVALAAHSRLPAVGVNSEAASLQGEKHRTTLTRCLSCPILTNTLQLTHKSSY